ncbi:hypothetical protein BKA56DRAFT_611972 [Ilyonectria sp. MPI-CAGE-AT-0026]|nr:hypothetical protein BKA56DRAFT_611972 [Ilyonectria sp. MPI-CAGE-AT-0026]
MSTPRRTARSRRTAPRSRGAVCLRRRGATRHPKGGLHTNGGQKTLQRNQQDAEQDISTTGTQGREISAFSSVLQVELFSSGQRKAPNIASTTHQPRLSALDGKDQTNPSCGTELRYFASPWNALAPINVNFAQETASEDVRAGELNGHSNLHVSEVTVNLDDLDPDDLDPDDFEHPFPTLVTFAIILMELYYATPFSDFTRNRGFQFP